MHPRSWHVCVIFFKVKRWIGEKTLKWFHHIKKFSENWILQTFYFEFSHILITEIHIYVLIDLLSSTLPSYHRQLLSPLSSGCVFRARTKTLQGNYWYILISTPSTKPWWWTESSTRINWETQIIKCFSSKGSACEFVWISVTLFALKLSLQDLKNGRVYLVKLGVSQQKHELDLIPLSWSLRVKAWLKM